MKLEGKDEIEIIVRHFIRYNSSVKTRQIDHLNPVVFSVKRS